MICVNCGSNAVLVHHVSYEPEIGLPVCGTCHRRIHLAMDGYEGFLPADQPSYRFYASLRFGWETRHQVSFRWDTDFVAIVDELAKKRGLTRSALIQLIIRERAAGEGVL